MRPQHWSRLTWPYGNNAFAYDERKLIEPDPKLWIPSMKQISSIDEIQLGSDPVFAELDTDKNVITYTGLKHLYKFLPSCEGGVGGGFSTPCFVFDNHNYALYCRARHLASIPYHEGVLQKPKVIHIDQHSDLGIPPPIAYDGNSLSFRERFAVRECNVGNFIRPALDSWLISECIWIKNQYDLERFPFLGKDWERLISSPLSKGGVEGGGIFLLDIDLDFRAPAMGTDVEKTIPLVQSLMKRASCITIATSPYFLDQTYALELLHLLFSQTHSDMPHTEDTNSKI